MEKLKQFRRSRLVTGLLIFFALSSPVFSQRLAKSTGNFQPQELSAIRIVPATDERLISGQDIKFILDIPDINPSDVEIAKVQFLDDIKIKGSRKTVNYDDGGTRIEFHLVFEKSGTFTPSPVELTVKRKKVSIPFNPVKISPNPRDLNPTFILEVRNKKNRVIPQKSLTQKGTFTQGEEYTITVYLQYAMRATSFTHQLPKDCIFTEISVKDFESRKNDYNENSQNIMELGTYGWNPLKDGEVEFPVFSADVWNYSSYHSIISSQKITVNASEESKAQVQKPVAQSSDETFYIEETPPKTDETDAKPEQNIENLWKKLQKRKFLLFVLLLVVITFTILICILFALRKKWKILVIVFCMGCIVSVPLWILATKKQNIFTGQILYAIPEDSASSSMLLKSGSVVQVISVVDDWYYIKTNTVSGWAKTGDLYGHE